MKSKYFLRVVSLLVLLVSLIPASNADALPFADPPAANFFQLPWEQGLAWVAIDGLDNGTRRPLSSSHNYSVGGAIDFAPHNNMQKGENTSRYWVTAAAGGKVVAKSFCHVKIDHNNGWTTEYQFLANVQVNVGDIVYRNQRLAIIANGTTQPFCPGSNEPNVPHVHFMLRPSIRNAVLAGWQVNYLALLNRTTFTKNGQTLGLFQPLLNALDLQIVMRGPITWDTLYTGSVDTYRYERWSLTLDEFTKFTLTATPTSTGLTPLIVLMDANGTEMARSPGTLTSTQPAGNYFVQIQPQVGNGFYSLILQKNDLPLPTGPYVSTTVTPTSVNLGGTATATVKLNNIPPGGYTSAEFTCTFNATLVEASNIVVSNLFGSDPAVAINGPQNGTLIVAIAGSKGSKATTSGTAFTFDIKGLQAGQTAVECKARVSTGNNVLTSIEFIPGAVTVLGNTSPTPTPGVPPTSPPVESPLPTVTGSPTPTSTPGSPEPTATFTPSPAPSTPTVLPSACDRAEFVADITVPPGTVMSPGATFTKTWRLKNIGPCTWTTSYKLVFFSGEMMGAVSSASFPVTVATGQQVDFSLNMTAPNAPGTYRGYWMFMNSNGANFGIGPDANQPWFVEITVSGPTLPPSLTPTTPPSSPTPTLPGGDWLIFTNQTYGFRFLYPSQSQIVAGGTDNSTRINLPFVQGTNLSQKWMQMTVAENVNPCRSPLATSSIPQTSETVVINNITFLKETGEDGTAGHINKWTAYSTVRNNACVSLDFVLRAANPGVFTTPPPLYDEAAESLVFGQIVSTFQWLDSPVPATPTPTSASTPVESPTPTAGPSGTLTGQVLASKPVTVSLYNAEDVLVTSAAANPDGTFSLNAPAGTYTVTATASGFLLAEGSVTIIGGGSSTKPTVTLLAGDIDGNDVIDQFDALTIGMSYNTATPSEGDLNSDGVINVLDLELLAANYRKSAPQDWL